MEKTTPNVSSHEDNEQVRDKAIRLFTFLKELSSLRTTTIRTIGQYDEVLWLDEIPRESGCDCICWRENGDKERAEVWIEIRKPPLKSPPSIPDDLEPWLDPQQVADSSQDMPELRERILVDAYGEDGPEEQETRFLASQDCPDIETLWERYVSDKWWPWAQEDRRLQAVQRTYTSLFSIYQKQQRLGEKYEVVVGLGYLTWRTLSEQEIRRHIITAQAALHFDPGHGVIKVGLAAEGAKPVLEQDMLEADERPDAAEQNDIKEKVDKIGNALWEGDQVQEVLRAWVHAVSARGEFHGDLAPQPEAGPHPMIHFAPALILRKRTERSLLRTLQQITDQLCEGEVPIGVRRLVTIMDDRPPSPGSGEGSDEVHPGAAEIYFPLPANNEQKQILQELSVRQGVLVQGPPGTGKSHTIANLVSHLLATGQRVLVTSHTARALKVLREKMPEGIRDLCVLLLGNDLDARRSLEDSVGGITTRYNNWNKERNLRRTVELEKQLDEARRTEACTFAELRAMRERETYRYPLQFGVYEGTAQAIAKRVGEETSRHSWLPTRPEEKDEPPLSNGEAAELLRLLRQIDPGRKEELRKCAVELDSLVSPREFESLVQKEANARDAYEMGEKQRDHPGYAALMRSSRERREALCKELSDLLCVYQKVVNHIQSWTEEAATQILADRDRAWCELRDATREALDTIGGRARRVSEFCFTSPKARDRAILKADAKALLDHLQRGGKLGFGLFRPKVVRKGIYLIKEFRVDGVLCERPQPLRDLLEWIEVADILDRLQKYWSGHTDPPRGSFAKQVAEYEDLCEPLELALSLHDTVRNLKEMIAAIPGLGEPKWHDSDNVQALLEVAEATRLEEELREARSNINVTANGLRAYVEKPNAHPMVAETLEAVKSRDTRHYAECQQFLCELGKAREALGRRSVLLDRLQMAAPELASELALTHTDQVWDDRITEFTAAWNWARAKGWIERLNDLDEQERLTVALDHCRDLIRKLVAKLAETRAWRYCLSRLTKHEEVHLKAWEMAIRRYGKGTGKYANKHLRDARKNMDECRSAIPAWVMPVYRVAETLEPRADMFDVVIVDEASQSGLEALFLWYLGKKIVVVGDDKQISPESVGIDRTKVELLQQSYIHDLPLIDALGVDNSFFDQAEIRYGGRIRLQEHFRCMPEIIQFSNNLCYASQPLVPLRQYGRDRLPPVKTRQIQDGYQKGRSPQMVNPPEAEAIVEEIKKCCEDPAYDGKSMGVISLLGETQARRIESLLLEGIGPEEMEKRQLVCGDAYAFQGDERDVMFLSLVSAPTEGHRIGTLAKASDQRRFNVAASRARDQLWLFHSATLNDLSPGCLRYRLLEYCQNPVVESHTVGLDIRKLRSDAQNSNRDRIGPPSPFESWFEVDVFLRIVERDYRVIPQFEVARHRIDLVVEGMRGRLAVECDGDECHGADRHAQDMARQRKLERCGWTFWRVRGSSFYCDRDGAMEGLWSTLEGLGIYPSGEPPPGPSPITYRDEFGEALDRVQLSLKNSGGSMTKTKLWQYCRRQMDKHTMEAVIGRLIEAGTIIRDCRTLENSQKRSTIYTLTKPSSGESELQESPSLQTLESRRGEDISGTAPIDTRTGADKGVVERLGQEGRARGAALESAGNQLSLTPRPGLGRVRVVDNEDDTEGAATEDVVHVKPYQRWASVPLPDPRWARIDDIAEGLLKIVAVEGPMVCHRAYRIYAKAAGIARVGRQIRSVFNRAVYKAVRKRLLEQRDEHGTTDQLNRIIRKAGTPPVVLREHGDRTFHEIPPAEIGELMNHLLMQNPEISDEDLFRAILSPYGIRRMGPHIRTSLLKIKRRYVIIK